MDFGPVPLAEAVGAMLAHAVRTGGITLEKGRVLTASDIEGLRVAGMAEVTVARLGPDEVDENSAACAIAEALVQGCDGFDLTPAHTGRVNLKARGPGLVIYRPEVLTRLNLVDPGLTFAALPPFARVGTGQLAGTVKIITYGVTRQALGNAIKVSRGAVRHLAVRLRTAALVLTEVEGQDRKLADKARRVTQARLAGLGMALDDVRIVPHACADIAEALGDAASDLILILTGAATSDMRDTAPEAVRAAGGEVFRFGMPVDPGNLLFLGRIGPRPVIGLPGCARSPALNGADWVLERVACGMTLTDTDFAAMGAGGLLKEIAQRGRSREI